MVRLLRGFVSDTARLYRVHSRSPVFLVVILRSSRYMETVEAPKHRPIYWSYNKLFGNRLGVDVERNSDGVHKGISERESDQPGESFPVILPDR